MTTGSSEETGAFEAGAWLLGAALDGVDEDTAELLLCGTSSTPLTASLAGKAVVWLLDGTSSSGVA